jgi:oligoribonuclease
LSEGPIIAIHQSNTRLEAMDEWNTQQHGQSGLTARVQTSDYDVAYAEQQTLAFLQKYVPKGESPMCGNSICQDRRFMARLMPELEAYFHYRNLDVSTLKELTQRWQPNILSQFEKQGTHLAMDDIRESIAEMRFYRKSILKI